MSRSLHPFPARMAPDIAMGHLAEADGNPLRVLDPMCGSGTVLGVAAARGHHAIGIDIDPLAVLMSDVATRAVDTATLLEAAAEASQRARESTSIAMPWRDEETRTFASFWFDEPQRLALARLTAAVGRIEELAVRQALQIAMSRMIVTKSPKASLASDTAHSRPHRTISKSDFDVVAGFGGSAKAVAKILGARELKGSASVSLGDSRKLRSLGKASIDLAISSPPYLNAIDYLRGHKLSLIWLGYSISELRKIRSESIGAERAPDSSAHTHAQAMVSSVEAMAVDPQKLPVKTLNRYAIDLCGFGAELAHVVRPAGKAVLVVGNSTLRGNYIRNDDLCVTAMQSAGFELATRVSRELPENRRYMPVKSSGENQSMTKRMRTESVLAFVRL